jgi:predicted DNA-binding transcriptional regulator AlpA
MAVRTAPLERLWSARDVAEFLGVPIATLYQWRHLGTGPKAYRVGRHLRYDPGEVRRWLEEDT